MTRPRRRSALLGISAIAISAGVAGCQQEPQVSEQLMTVYASADECAQVQERAACDAAFQKAIAEHEQTAPRYATREECEANFSPEVCQQRQGSNGSFFMPLMMGMMMGRMMSGPAYPVTMDRSGAAYSGTTRVLDPDPARRPGTMPRSINAPVTAGGAIADASTTRRGGFGASSSYRGSAGG